MLRAFGRLPNWVLQSKQLTLAAKVVAANRVTYTGKYKARVRTQSRLVSRGLGKNNAAAAVAALRREGFFGREQQRWAVARGTGITAPLGELNELIEIPSRDFSIVRRAWFDGQLTLYEAAALLFINAGLKGPVTYADEVAGFLGKSERKAGACLQRLEDLGLIAADHRSSDGRFTRRGYRLAGRRGNHRNLTGCRNAGGDISGDLLTTPLDIRFPLTQTAGAGPALDSIPAGSDIEQSDPSLSEADGMWTDDRLLGWVDAFKFHRHLHQTFCDFCYLDEEAVEEVEEALSPEDLATFIVFATEGRVAPVILSPAGLSAIYWMAAFVMVHAEWKDPSPADALAFILNAFADRVGRQPPTYLASLRLVAERLIWGHGPEHIFYVAQRLFQSSRPEVFAVSKDDELFVDAAL